MEPRHPSGKKEQHHAFYHPITIHFEHENNEYTLNGRIIYSSEADHTKTPDPISFSLLKIKSDQQIAQIIYTIKQNKENLDFICLTMPADILYGKKNHKTEISLLEKICFEIQKTEWDAAFKPGEWEFTSETESEEVQSFISIFFYRKASLGYCGESYRGINNTPWAGFDFLHNGSQQWLSLIHLHHPLPHSQNNLLLQEIATKTEAKKQAGYLPIMIASYKNELDNLYKTAAEIIQTIIEPSHSSSSELVLSPGENYSGISKSIMSPLQKDILDAFKQAINNATKEEKVNAIQKMIRAQIEVNKIYLLEFLTLELQLIQLIEPELKQTRQQSIKQLQLVKQALRQPQTNTPLQNLEEKILAMLKKYFQHYHVTSNHIPRETRDYATAIESSLKNIITSYFQKEKWNNTIFEKIIHLEKDAQEKKHLGVKKSILAFKQEMTTLLNMEVSIGEKEHLVHYHRHYSIN